MFLIKTKTSKTYIALAITLLTVSCASGPNGKLQEFEKTFKDTFASEDPCSNNARNIGIVGGSVLGAVLAKASDNAKIDTMVVGAGIGALLGGLIGADMDRRRCELTKLAKAHNLDIVMTDISFVRPAAATAAKTSANAVAVKKPAPVGMSLSIFDHGNQFETGSSLPSAQAIKAFGDVADLYHQQGVGKDAQATQIRNKQMRILLVGHTDDTGSSALNADLSEERARALAKIFVQRGFSASQLYFQGAGEVFPIDNNNTAEGRARNRRVEVVDLSDDATFAAFLAARRPTVAHYRPAVQSKPNIQIAAITPTLIKRVPDAHKAPGISSPVKLPLFATTPEVFNDSTSNMQTNSGSAKGTPLNNLDFGGKPTNGQYRGADIGKTTHASSFSITSSAHVAEESLLGSCATDRARISRSVKSMGTGQAIKTSEYLPGTANASWAGKTNGHLVGLSNVSVLRDGGQPAGRPVLMVWKNYIEGGKAPPDLKTTADVNAYQGDKALLYRVFLDQGPVRCIDLVIPNGAANTAPTSSLVYERNSAIYQADYSPAIAR